jgi:hypothetical protein
VPAYNPVRRSNSTPAASMAASLTARRQTIQGLEMTKYHFSGDVLHADRQMIDPLIAFGRS